MKKTSTTFEQKNLWDTSSVTSSEESAGGRSLFDSQDGRTNEPSGQPACPASPSPRRASKKGKPTADTSGLCSFGSSESADLQFCLANRLLQTLDVDGSLEYEMTWKRRGMQSGAPICRLAARARRTSAKGCSGALAGYPTPNARDKARSARKNQSGEGGNQFLDERVAEWFSSSMSDPLSQSNVFESKEGSPQANLAGWPTATVGDASNTRNRTARRNDAESGHHDGQTLVDAVELVSGWPTPMAGTPATEECNAAGNNDYSRAVEALVPAGWASPACRDSSPGRASQETMDRNARPLNEQVVNLAGWTTPQASEPDTEDRTSRAETGRTTEYLGRQVKGLAGWATPTGAEKVRSEEFSEGRAPTTREVLECGTTTSSSPAGTTRFAGSVLSPAMSRWLQGFPRCWDHCSPHWSDWASIQSWLAELYASPGATATGD